MRSIWKGPFFNYNILAYQDPLDPARQHIPLKLAKKNGYIYEPMVHRSFLVYNGRRYNRMTIEFNMLGHRLGEFLRTRTRVVHLARKRKKELEKRRKEETKKTGASKALTAAQREQIEAMKRKRKKRK